MLLGAAAGGACRFRHGAFDKPFAHIAPAFDNGRCEGKADSIIAVAEEELPTRLLGPSVVGDFQLYNHTAFAVVGNVVAVMQYIGNKIYKLVVVFEYFLADGDISAVLGL